MSARRQVEDIVRGRSRRRLAELQETMEAEEAAKRADEGDDGSSRGDDDPRPQRQITRQVLGQEF